MNMNFILFFVLFQYLNTDIGIHKAGRNNTNIHDTNVETHTAEINGSHIYFSFYQYLILVLILILRLR